MPRLENTPIIGKAVRFVRGLNEALTFAGAGISLNELPSAKQRRQSRTSKPENSKKAE